MINWILQIILQAIGIFVKDQAKKLEIENKIKAEIKRYEKGVGDSAKVREEHKKLDDKLEDAWQKKFGTVVVEPTSEVTVNEAFLFEIELPEGLQPEVWAEKQYLMGTMMWNRLTKKYQISLAFNQPGVRVIGVKVDAEWKASKTITVRPA